MGQNPEYPNLMYTLKRWTPSKSGFKAEPKSISKLTLSLYIDEERVDFVKRLMKQTRLPMNAVISWAIDCLRAYSEFDMAPIRDAIREEARAQRREDSAWFREQVLVALELRKERKR